jgi:hypothetical protein
MFSGLSQDKFQRIMMLSLTVVLVLLTVGALGFVIGYLPRLLMGKKENLPRKPSKVNNS